MKQVSELPHAVGEARRRPGVVAVPVDGDGRAWKLEARRTLGRLVCAESAWAEDDQLGLERDHFLPGRRPRGRSPLPEHVLPPGALDHLREPMTGTERGIDPLREEHPPPPGALAPGRCARAVPPPHPPAYPPPRLDPLEPRCERHDRRGHLSQ